MLVFMDSGGGHYSSSDIAKKWSTNSSWTVTSGRFNGFALIGSGGNTLKKTLSIPVTGVIIGFAFSISSISSNSLNIFNTYLDSNIKWSVYLNSSGALNIYRGNSTTGTLLTTTSPNVIRLDTYHYIELKVYPYPTNVLAIRCDNKTLVSLSGAFTVSGAINTIELIGSTAFKYDDVYVCNSLGTKNNDFLGDLKVTSLLINSPGRILDWSPSGKVTNTLCSSAMDGDSGFIFTTIVNNTDLYKLNSFTTGCTGVVAVQNNITATQSASGTNTITSVIGNGSTENISSTNITPTSNYICYTFEYDNNPITSSDWSVANIASLEAGVRLTG